jgi:hypothetical protein
VTSQDFTVALFCRVDDALPHLEKHILASLAPSEVVTLGLLHVLRGEGQRAFYRWVQKELSGLFPRLPERTRLFRLLQQHAHATQHFLARPSLFCVCDTYGIELIHPLREGRSQRQIGRKGKSNRRWIVGAKCFVLCNDAGQIVEWECGSANLHDTVFHCALEAFEDKAIVLADKGFKAKKGTPSCLKICDRGAWNERMLVETLFSLFTNVLHMKKLSNRVWGALRARLAYTVAAYNLCTAWSGEVKLELAPFAL